MRNGAQLHIQGDSQMETNHNGGQSIRLFNEHEVAAQLALSVATIRRWRLLRQGPKWLKLGSAVRYRPEDVQAYLDGRVA